MTGYDFHPEAEADLNEIWGYIAAENVNAADRVMANIHRALENLVPFPFWTSGGSTRSVNGPGLNRIVRYNSRRTRRTSRDYDANSPPRERWVTFEQAGAAL